MSICAVEPATKNLATILFPLLTYKNLWKDSGNSFMAVSCSHKHLGSKILGQDYFVKQTADVTLSSKKICSLFAEGLTRCWKKITRWCQFLSWWIWRVLDCIINSSKHFCTFSLNLRWHRQVKNYLLWTHFPVFITPMIAIHPGPVMLHWAKQRSFLCLALLSPSSHRPWNTRIPTFTYTATCICIHYGQ